MGQESCNSRMCKFCTLFRTRFGIGELLSAVSQTEVHSSILSHTHTYTHTRTHHPEGLLWLHTRC